MSSAADGRAASAHERWRARLLGGRRAVTELTRSAASVTAAAWADLPKIIAPIVSLFLALVPVSSRATAQVPDTLLLDGREEALFTNPLGAYLATRPDAIPKSNVVSSGNWRGYVATWAIDGDRLVLSRISITVEESAAGTDETQFVAKDVTSAVFPAGAPVHATWYSGALVVPRGKEVDYVHMGYASTYEKYTILSVSAGYVTARRELSHEEFIRYRDEKFRAFKKTGEYKNRLAEITQEDGSWSASMAENFLKTFYAEQYLSR